MKKSFLLAIDQGTTSSRSIVFDQTLQIVSSSQKEFKQYFPDAGWVEHDVEEIWRTVCQTAKDAVAHAKIQPEEIAGIGITNQRETVVLWERATGKPFGKAIVWQDRRTASICEELKKEASEMVTKKTGLLLDPYFSGTKLTWLFRQDKTLKERAKKGEICFGTIDSFLIFRLTAGKVHRTDATNACRTLLYNLEKNEWDEELLALFQVPKKVLPEIMDCAADYGASTKDFLGAPINIFGVAGDQHAATLGNACFEKNMLKATYGTGCFAVLNTGDKPSYSKNRLLTTLAYRLQGKSTYALEASIFIAGAAVQWLRDGLGIIENAKEMDGLAMNAEPSENVVLVPAFSGLGAPYWDSAARGALFGLTRNCGKEEIAKATLESVAFQTYDLIEAMKKDLSAGEIETIRVDGGMVASEWMMQRIADLTQARIEIPEVLESTAKGVAWLAGSHAGISPDGESYAKTWQAEKTLKPHMKEEERRKRLASWKWAVNRTLSQRA